ncbi:MAG: flippase-like domain-containing protein [Deltaproteobacteria bacterium]|nr:flippase-like domain-containing protein [Deltaproteobacteria bacterium]
MTTTWLLVAAIFFVIFLKRNWDDISQRDWTVDWQYLSIAFFFFFLNKLVAGVQWALITHYRQEANGPNFILYDICASFISGMALYIPGNYWNLAALYKLSTKRGESGLSTSVGIFYQVALNMWASGLVGLYALYNLYPLNIYYYLGAVLLLVCLPPVVLHPKIGKMLVGKFSKLPWLDTFVLKHEEPFKLQLFLIMPVANIVAGGVANFFLAKALFPGLANEIFLLMVSAWALAWIAGYITPIAPAGLGVREGVFVLFLKTYMASGLALVVTVASRIMLALVDFIFGSLALLWLRKLKHVPA